MFESPARLIVIGVKSLLFDLDGTLWDAVVPITEAWLAVGRKYFGPSFALDSRDVGSCMGKTMDEIAKLITPEGADPSLLPDFIAESFRYEIEYLFDHPGTLYPRELETLRELSKRYDLYIVSNAQAGYIENYLKVLPEPLFKGHMCWSDTKQEKAVTIGALLSRYGIDKLDAIYIGDTKKDREAAHKAGIGFIYCAYGFEKTPLEGETALRRFADLPRVLPK